jgi:hypothetical protein
MNDEVSDKVRLDVRESDTGSAADAPTPTENDPVGYRSPPVASRFKPGQSGNLRGRPKGKRSVGAILQDVMNRKISVTENGKTRRVSALEAMLHRMRSDALRGDKPTLKILLPLYERYADTAESGQQTEDLLREDREILAKYGTFNQAAAAGTEPDDDPEPDAPARDEVDQ